MDITRGCTVNYGSDYLLIHDSIDGGQPIGYYCGNTIPDPLTSRSNKIEITFNTDEDSTGAGSGFHITFTAIDPPPSTLPTVFHPTTSITLESSVVYDDWNFFGIGGGDITDISPSHSEEPSMHTTSRPTAHSEASTTVPTTTTTNRLASPLEGTSTNVPISPSKEASTMAYTTSRPPTPSEASTIIPATTRPTSPSEGSSTHVPTSPSTRPPTPLEAPSMRTTDRPPEVIPGGLAQVPYPHDIFDPEGIHESCDALPSMELQKLDAFIRMGTYISGFDVLKPPEWLPTDISSDDSEDALFEKTLITNFVIGSQDALDSVADVVRGMSDLSDNLKMCIRSYVDQLLQLMSPFQSVNIPRLRESNFGVEGDLPPLLQGRMIEPSAPAHDFIDKHPRNSRDNNITEFTQDFFGNQQIHWCSSVLTSPSGIISSPNYPAPYPKFTSCQWRIPVQPYKSVAIKFTDFNLGRGQVCSWNVDKVTVTVTTIGEPKVTDTYCGSAIPPIIVSPMFAAEVTIKMVAPGNERFTGFQAVYTMIDPEDALEPGYIQFPSVSDGGESPEVHYLKESRCSFTYTSPSGQFDSPALQDVPTGCEWNITVAEDNLIKLNILSFSPPPNSIRCERPYAYIEIWDIVGDAVQNEYLYCGQEGLFSITSTSNKLLVIFHRSQDYPASFKAHYASINTGEHKLFPIPPTEDSVLKTKQPAQKDQANQLTADSTCRKVFHEPRGNFTSPKYPSNYEANMICTWTILADEHKHIGLKFVDFDVDNPMPNGICVSKYSYVRISYFDKEGQIASDQFCGFKVPTNVTRSYSHQMVIYFFSELGVGRGFLAEYDTFDGPYGSPVFSAIKPSSGDDNKVDGYSSEQVPPEWPIAISDSCGDVLTYSGSVFASPGYPKGYGGYSSCSWVIVAGAKQYINLKFRDFDVGIPSEEDGSCYESPAFVEVSYSSYGQVVSKYLCGSIDPQLITSLSDQMKVYFTSHQGGQKGFLAEINFFSSDENDSGGKDYIIPTDDGIIDVDVPEITPEMFTVGSTLLAYESSGTSDSPEPEAESDFCSRMNTNCCFVLDTESSGSIVSPGYPDGYDKNMNCKWLIEADDDQTISLVFTDFELDSVIEESEDCSGSMTNVRVVYYQNKGMMEKYFCGHALPTEVVSDFKILYVEFHSVDVRKTNDKGFMAVYHKDDKEVSVTDGMTLSTEQTGGGFDIGGDIFRRLFPLIPVEDMVNTSVSTETPRREVSTTVKVQSTPSVGILTKPSPSTERPGGDTKQNASEAIIPNDGEGKSTLDMKVTVTTAASPTLYSKLRSTWYPSLTRKPVSSVSPSSSSVMKTVNIKVKNSSSEIKLPDMMSWSESLNYESNDYEEETTESTTTDGDVETVADRTLSPESGLLVNTTASPMPEPITKETPAPSAELGHEPEPLWNGTSSNTTVPLPEETPAPSIEPEPEPLRNGTSSNTTVPLPEETPAPSIEPEPEPEPLRNGTSSNTTVPLPEETPASSIEPEPEPLRNGTSSNTTVPLPEVTPEARPGLDLSTVSNGQRPMGSNTTADNSTPSPSNSDNQLTPSGKASNDSGNATTLNPINMGGRFFTFRKPSGDSPKRGDNSGNTPAAEGEQVPTSPDSTSMLEKSTTMMTEPQGVLEWTTEPHSEPEWTTVYGTDPVASPELKGAGKGLCVFLKGKRHPNQNYAFFVCYLKIISTYLKIVMIKLYEKVKNGISILVG